MLFLINNIFVCLKKNNKIYYDCFVGCCMYDHVPGYMDIIIIDDALNVEYKKGKKKNIYFLICKKKKMIVMFYIKYLDWILILLNILVLYTW